MSKRLLELDLTNDREGLFLVAMMKNGAATKNGALPIGTRIEKQNSEPGDNFRDGQLGIVTGNITVPAHIAVEFPGDFAYLVLWDGLDQDTFISGRKIKQHA